MKLQDIRRKVDKIDRELLVLLHERMGLALRARRFKQEIVDSEREEAVLEFNKICQYRVSMLPYLLDKLKNTMDGDMNLLDRSHSWHHYVGQDEVDAEAPLHE